MNEITKLALFFNSSFEFISLIVYVTIGIFLLLYIRLFRIEGECRYGRKIFIAVSFSANALVLLLRQILDLNWPESVLHDLSSFLIMMQLFYPLTFHLQSVTYKRVNVFKLIMNTLIPLVFANVITTLMIHFRIVVQPVYLIVGGALLTLYIVYRILNHTCSYCIHLFSLIREPYGMKRELFRIVLVITGASIFIISLSNILISSVNSLMSPSLFIVMVLSILTTYRIIKDERGYSMDYNIISNEDKHLISPRMNRVEDYRQNKLKERLEEYFDISKPYLNKKISIKDIAKVLFTNKTYLSKVINESMGVNFNQLVNSYRMKEVDNLLKEDPHMGMKELCDKSGFGCMATFVVAFRLNKGAPPAEWCKKNARNLGKTDKDMDNEKES